MLEVPEEVHPARRMFADWRMWSCHSLWYLGGRSLFTRQEAGARFEQATISTRYDITTGVEGIRDAIDDLCDTVVEEVKNGVEVIVLSDFSIDQDELDTTTYIPPLVAVGAVHHRLIDEGLRMDTGLIVENRGVGGQSDNASVMMNGDVSCLFWEETPQDIDEDDNEKKEKDIGDIFGLGGDNERKAKTNRKVIKKKSVVSLNANASKDKDTDGGASDGGHSSSEMIRLLESSCEIESI